LDYLEKVRDKPRVLSLTNVYPDDPKWPETLNKTIAGGCCRGLKIHPIAQQLDPTCDFRIKQLFSAVFY